MDEDDKHRGQGRAFIPEENRPLQGFRKVFSRLLSFSMTLGGASKDRDGKTVGASQGHGTSGRCIW